MTWGTAGLGFLARMALRQDGMANVIAVAVDEAIAPVVEGHGELRTGGDRLEAAVVRAKAKIAGERQPAVASGCCSWSNAAAAFAVRPVDPVIEIEGQAVKRCCGLASAKPVKTTCR